MSTDTPDDGSDVFDELYAKHGEAYEDIAESDLPAAPLAQLIVDEATGGDDDD